MIPAALAALHPVPRVALALFVGAIVAGLVILVIDAAREWRQIRRAAPHDRALVAANHTPTTPDRNAHRAPRPRTTRHRRSVRPIKSLAAVHDRKATYLFRGF